MSNHTSRDGALVIFPGALGDFVCLVPALRELRARHGGLTIVCKGDLAPLARLAGARDVRPIEGRVGTWPFLAEPPAEAIELFDRHQAIHGFSGSGSVEVERSFARFGEKARLHSFRPADAVHLATHYLRCVGSPRTAADAAGPDLEIVRALCTDAAPAASPQPSLIVHPGSGGRAKRWSRRGFAEIAGEWSRRTGARVTVLLGPAEEDEREHWSRAFDVVPAETDLASVARLLARAGTYLGNDSGISHLAGLVGARGAALFGPTDPELWRPLSPRIVAARLRHWSGADSPPHADAVAAVRRALAAAAASP